MTNYLQSLPNAILLIIANELTSYPEDVLRFGESSTSALQVISNSHFLKKISQQTFLRVVDDLDGYRRLAARFMVTRDSPSIIGLDKSLERASEKGDDILIDLFVSLYTGDNRKVNLNRGLVGAAAGGHKYLVKYFLSYGADDYKSAREKIVTRIKGNYIPFDYGYDISRKIYREEDPISLNYIECLNKPVIIPIGGGYEDLEIFQMLSPRKIDNKNELELEMIIAARKGDLAKVKRCLQKGVKNYPESSNEAAKGGHIEIIKLFRSLDDRIYEYNITELAAERGKTDLLTYILEDARRLYKESVTFISYIIFSGLIGAMHGERKDIVDMLRKFIDDNPSLRGKMDEDEELDIMARIAEKGYIDIIRAYVDRIKKEKEIIMAKAAKGGHLNIIQLVMEKGAKNYGDAMVNAACQGHMNIVKLMAEKVRTIKNKDKKFEKFSQAAEVAAQGGYLDIVNLLIEKGKLAKDSEAIERIMINGITNGNINIVRAMLLLMTEPISDDIIKETINSGYIDILRIILDKGLSKQVYDTAIRYIAEQKDMVVEMKPYIERALRTTKN